MLFRSQFEKRVALDIRMQGGKFEYEQHKIPYRPQVRSYTPDFYIPETDIYIEAKGRFISSDRTKMLMVQQQQLQHKIFKQKIEQFILHQQLLPQTLLQVM